MLHDVPLSCDLLKLYKDGYPNRPWEMIFWCQRIFFINFDFKNVCRNEFVIITKNHASDPEIGFLTIAASKPNCCATAMPISWELTY